MPATFLTLSSSPALLCQIGLKVERPLADVASEITTLAHATRASEHHIHATFRDPLDAVLGWRHLDTLFGSQLAAMSIVASAEALEMLREPSLLATETWAWLVGDRAIPPADVDRGLFGVAQIATLRFFPTPIGEQHLPNGFGLSLAVIERTTVRMVHLTEPGWVGRAPRAPVRIEDVGKRHLELGVDSHEGWFARDAGSANGSFIAGAHLGTARQALYPGMTVQFTGQSSVVVLSVK